MNPEHDSTPPRRAFSIVEVSVAITILGAAAVAFSQGFSTGDGLVQAANESAWAVRLASQQADLVRRQLTVAAVSTPAEALPAPGQRLHFVESYPLGAGIDSVPRFSQPNPGAPANLRSMGVQKIPAGSPFYLLNATNTTPADALNYLLDGQMYRLVLYMTEVQVDNSPLPGVPVRDLGGRKVMACQVDVYRGIPGTVANDPTGGKFLFSMNFLARRYDLDSPTHVGPAGPTNHGFIVPRP